MDSLLREGVAAGQLQTGIHELPAGTVRPKISATVIIPLSSASFFGLFLRPLFSSADCGRSIGSKLGMALSTGEHAARSTGQPFRCNLPPDTHSKKGWVGSKWE